MISMPMMVASQPHDEGVGDTKVEGTEELATASRESVMGNQPIYETNTRLTDVVLYDILVEMELADEADE